MKNNCYNLFIYILIFCIIKGMAQNSFEKVKFKEVSELDENYLFDEKTNQINQIEYSYEFWGPTCIPLISKNIGSNPYHESLLSVKGAQTRDGFRYIPLQDMHDAGLKCPFDSPEPCTLSISRSFSISLQNSFSISQSNSFINSIVIGTQEGNVKSDSITKSISNSLEKSISKSITLSDEETISNQISDAIQRSHDESSGIVKSEAKEIGQTNTITQDLTESKTLSTELTIGETKSEEQFQSQTSGNSKSMTHGWNIGVSSSAGIPGIMQVETSFGVHGSYTDSTHNEVSGGTSIGRSETKSSSTGESSLFSKTIGKADSNTIAQSSSSSKENRQSDSISLTREASQTKSKHTGLTNSETFSDGNSYKIDDSYTLNKERQKIDSINTEKSNSTTNTTEFSFSKTIQFTSSFDQMFRISPGYCKIPVCQISVRSTAIPYECKKDNVTQIVYVELIKIDPKRTGSPDPSNPTFSCIKTIIDCHAKVDHFIVNNDEFNTPEFVQKSTMNYGQELTSENDFSLVSNNSIFNLKFDVNGCLVIKRYETDDWTNNMTMFDSSYQMRLRINEKGHLIQETKGFLNVSGYRENEWITIWSSVPINYNVTIGIPKKNGKSYKLVLSNDGQLNLYDSIGVLIWCSGEKCKHRFGYLFPEAYLVPTNFITPQILDDKHNNIPDKYSEYFSQAKSFLMSLDQNCSNMLISESSNSFLVSPNRRFSLILEDSGNLVLKDSYRTMWESLSGHIEHAISPFKLFLSPSSELVIVSANGYIVWTTAKKHTVNDKTGSGQIEYPYKLSLLDEGRLVITNRFDEEIWESWPIRNMSNAYTIRFPYEFSFVPCDGKSKVKIKKLKTFGDRKRSLQNKLDSSTRLISYKSFWDLVILKDKLIVLRHFNIVVNHLFNLTYLDQNSEIEHLLLDKNGDLKVIFRNKYDSDNLREHFIWKSYLQNNDGNFTLELNQTGKINIKRNENETIWSFPNLKKKERIIDRVAQNKSIEINDNIYLKKNNESEKITACFKLSLWSVWSECVNGSQTRFKYYLTKNEIIYPNKSTIISFDITNRNQCNNDQHLDFKDCLDLEYNFLKNFKIVNKKVYETRNLDPLKCWNKCKKDNLCVGITFENDAFCYLFSDDFEVKENKKWQTYIKKKIPINCKVSEWSNWSTCKNLNDHDHKLLDQDENIKNIQIKIRTRALIRPNQNNGQECPPLIEFKSC